MKTVLITTLITTVGGGLGLLAAAGLGLYVYPTQPELVWSLLFVCWACYRLRLLALARFGPAPARQTAPRH